MKKNILFAHKIIEQIADNVMITDRDGIILYVNPAFIKTTGFSYAEVLGKNPNILQSGKHGADYYEKLWGTILAGKVFRAITTNKSRKGKLLYIDQTISPIKDEHDNITHFISVWKDITERIEISQKLVELTESLRFEKYKLEQILSFDEKVNSINKLDQLIDFIIEKACDILESERCSLMLLDPENNELCIKGSKGLPERYIKQKPIKIGEGICGKVAKKGEALLVENIEKERYFKRKNRSGFRTKSFICVPIFVNKKLVGVFNISEKKLKVKEEPIYTELELKVLSAIVRQGAVAIENALMFKELNFLTVTDPMTGVFNHRYFISNLDHEIRRSNRFLHPLSLILLDVDDFKSYNDTYGHLEGDELIRSITRVLKESLRQVDIVCRYAGDEFVVILPETNQIGAKIAAEKILKNIEGLKLKRKVTVSIGISSHKKDISRQDLIAMADRALYQAKKHGKNKMECFS